MAAKKPPNMRMQPDAAARPAIVAIFRGIMR
jgi:hypothetical protein